MVGLRSHTSRPRPPHVPLSPIVLQSLTSPRPLVAILVLLLLALIAFSHARPSSTNFLSKDFHAIDPEAGFNESTRVRTLNFSKGGVLDPRQDDRGWMIDPLAAAATVGLYDGATSCSYVHLGEVRPGKMRGNHRHHNGNETMVLWGAKMRLRNEVKTSPKGYEDVKLDWNEVAVVSCPADYAHAVTNIDERRVAYIFACQDAPHDPSTDYNVWSDFA